MNCPDCGFEKEDGRIHSPDACIERLRDALNELFEATWETFNDCKPGRRLKAALDWAAEIL